MKQEEVDGILSVLKQNGQDACSTRLNAFEGVDLENEDRDKILRSMADSAAAEGEFIGVVEEILKGYVTQTPTAPLIRDINFARGGNREGLEVYGPGARGGAAWGQNVKTKSDGTQTADRTGWYGPEHARQEDDSIHIDMLKDSRSVAGTQGWTCWFGATRGPKSLRAEVVASIKNHLGSWLCPVWLTAIPGGWSDAEFDHGEAFGKPASNWEHNQYAMASHLGFDGLTKRPYMNAQSNILLKPLGKNHWRKPIPDGIRTWGLQVLPVEGDGWEVEWSVDGEILQTLNTRDFEKYGYDLRTVVRKTTAWNVYSCTQAGPFPGNPPKEELRSGMILKSMKVWDLG